MKSIATPILAAIVFTSLAAYAAEKTTAATESKSEAYSAEKELRFTVHGVLVGIDKDVVRIKTGDGKIMKAPRSVVDTEGLVVGKAKVAATMEMDDYMRLNGEEVK